MIIRKFILSLVLLFAMIISGCTRGPVFEDHISFGNHSWNRFEELEFDMPVKSTSHGYAFFISIHFTEDLKASLLPINFTFTTPDGEFRSLNYDLRFRDYDNNFRGKKADGHWELIIPLRMDFRFSEEGNCHFFIENRSSKVETPGISSVGIIVAKAKED